MAANQLLRLDGVPVLLCPRDGPTLRTDGDALDLIADAIGQGAELVAVPVPRLAAEFFTLSTRLAGEITQKFVNYRLRLAIVGDIANHLAASSALQAFVSEANHGGVLWFVTSLEELTLRLVRPRGTGRAE